MKQFCQKGEAMSISIVTPTHNDFKGLLEIYTSLQNQTSNHWEWVIVDDRSSSETQNELQGWFHSIKDQRVKLICNSYKSNASVCRNIGAQASTHDDLIFLDADDAISNSFVEHRLISFQDFAIFRNYATIDKNKKVIPSTSIEEDYLNSFLQAKFIWQTSLVLWKKSFFNSIGQFNPRLPRLQDVELIVRGLQQSSNYLVVDNMVDFYYNVIPIRERNNFLKPVCQAVYLFISELLDTSQLSKEQTKLLTGYYYLCVKYLERSGRTVDIDLVHKNLKLFYSKGYIGWMKFVIGRLLLLFFTLKILSPNLFLRINRRIFKPFKRK